MAGADGPWHVAALLAIGRSAVMPNMGIIGAQFTGTRSGLRLGTHSAVPYAASCMVARTVRLLPCRFAVESSADLRLQMAVLGMPAAGALLNV